jgi:TolB-like protein/Flp pilus assembly protein TadD
MPDVFISKARSTSATAQAAATALRSLGYSVWIDDELPAHRAYGKVIQEQVTAAKAVLVLWSSDAIESEWVLSEAERGRTARKLVQASLDGTRPPMPFDQIQCADLLGWRGTDLRVPGWRTVVSSIAELVGADQAANPTAVASASAPVAPNSVATNQRQRVLSAALIAFATVAAVSWYVVSRVPDRATSAKPSDSPPGAQVSNQAQAGDVPFADRPAIAVLPFENRSDDPKDAIFADGLPDDLIGRLSSWRAFPVIARGSSFHYRGNVDLKRVGSDLGARYVVQGSVQRSGDRIRISVQLVDTQSTKTLWSQTYDRAVADVFALQDEIGETVAVSLVADINRAEGERAQQRGIKNLDAWGAYELGMQHLIRRSPKDNADARGLFEQAQALEQAPALDPQSASVTAAVSITYSNDVFLGYTDSPDSSEAQALNLARSAVELDPGNSLAHAALAYALAVNGNPGSAIGSAERAVELNPSEPRGWATLALAQDLAGDPKAAVAAIERAIRLDPQSDSTTGYFDFLSMASFDAGEYAAGLEASRKVVATYPDYFWGYISLAGNAVQLGRIDEARAAIVEARRLQPNLSKAMIHRTLGVSRPDIDARWNAALSQAGLD